MSEEDFRALVRLLQNQLEEIGLPEFGYAENLGFTAADGERAGPYYRKLAIEMLQAFERHLAIHDPAVISGALASIKKATENAPKRLSAEVYVSSDSRGVSAELDVISLTFPRGYRRLRTNLRKLIADLQQAPHSGPSLEQEG